MIAFLTSLRARALAKDWSYHVWLLEQTIRSMLAQASGTVQVVVGCHDIPDTPFSKDSRVQFLPISCDPPARDNDDMCVDKVLKLSVGAEWAIERGCDYVVFNDADDLVSNRLGAFIEQQRGAVGWYTASEMFYTYGGRVVRWYDIPGRSAGPCLIVRSDLLSFAAPPFSGSWTEILHRGGETRYLQLLERHRAPVATLAAVGLGNYRELMEAEGAPLAPLPFAANIVINHVDSTATVSGGIGSYDSGRRSGRRTWKALMRLKSTLRKLRSLRLINDHLRMEFCVPDDGRIPAPYKRGGSVLWR